MKDRSKVIFGNEMSSRVYHKAEKSKKKYSKKLGMMRRSIIRSI